MKKVVGFTIDEDLNTKLEELSKKTRIKKSVIVNDWIKEHLKDSE